MINNKKAQAELRLFIGLVIITIGVLAVSFIGFGFMFNSPILIWAGSIVLGLISIISAIFEKVLLK